MSFNSLLTHTITTYRNVPNGTGSQRSYLANLVGLKCLIQPVSASFAQTTSNVFGRTYNLYLPLGSDLQLSDKLTDQDGKQYSVQGSLKRNYGGSSPHLSIMVVEEPRSIPDS